MKTNVFFLAATSFPAFNWSCQRQRATQMFLVETNLQSKQSKPMCTDEARTGVGHQMVSDAEQRWVSTGKSVWPESHAIKIT